MSKKWMIRLIISIFVPIQIWFLFIMFHYPFLDFGVKKIDGNWTITDFDSRSVTARLGLQVGDIILSVDGKDVDKLSSVIKWGTVDKVNHIQVLREGKTFQANVTKFASNTDQDVLSIFSEIICIIVAFVLYKWMPRSRSALHLSFLFFNLGVVFMSLGASIRGDALGKFIIVIGVMLIPTTLLHFLVTLLKEKGNLSIHNVLRGSYIFISISLILEITFFFKWTITRDIHRYYADVALAFFVIGVLIDFWFLMSVYSKNKKTNLYVSTMIKTIGLSFAISILPIVCLSFIPKVLYGNEWVDSLFTSWMVLFFPLSFTYLLATKKIYDIDLVIRRFILTTVVSIIPSAFIIGMISLLFSVQNKAEHLVMAFLFTVVLLSVTLYSLEYLTNRMEKVVFPRRHFLQASIKNMAKKLGLIHSIRDLKDIILVDIVDILQVSGGAIVFRYHNFIETISDGEIDTEEAEAMIREGITDHPSLTCLEINRNEEYSSHLVLTAKKTNTLLGTEEMQWLNLVISYLSVSMENLFLIRKLTVRMEQLAAQIPNEDAGEFAWFRKIMFELQEKERSRIATDLHDTTMQDLFFLKRKIGMLFEQSRGAKDSSQEVNGILEYIDVINMNLRQSCFELHPYLLQEIGLVGTIEKLLDLERMVVPFAIDFRAFGREIIEAGDMETKRHLFRVVQELLNNAKKHSNATKVIFQLKIVHSNIVLFYEDDGVGFEADRTVPREIGGSRMGMEQMKSRILSLNGYFELVTAKGKGMRFTATLPRKEGMTA